MKKILCMICLGAVLCLSLLGCRTKGESAQSQGGTEYYSYYVSVDETELLKEDYTPSDETAQTMLLELMNLISSDELENGICLLPKEVSINQYKTGEDGVLVIDFNARYKKLSRAREILVRAGIVKTFVQVPGIRAVRFTVNEKPLLNEREQEIGEMNADSFAAYPGEDMDAYRNETFTLYFADKSGEQLVEETRKLYYKRSLKKERVVLEQLAKGPMIKGHYPTIPENFGINDITVSDRICYLDLDRSFLDYTSEVSPEISVYSIVNSITSACEVDKVQISVEGAVEGTFLEGVELYKFYEKNEDLVAAEAEQKEE